MLEETQEKHYTSLGMLNLEIAKSLAVHAENKLL